MTFIMQNAPASIQKINENGNKKKEVKKTKIHFCFSFKI
jgi:hypothetical protein